MKTEVLPPGPPVWTMFRPGTVWRTSGKVRRWLRSMSSAEISVTELPISLTGVSIRVALTTIPSDSASEFESADDVASCARQNKDAAKRKAATMSHERFRITSYLQFFREADSAGCRRRRVHSSHSSFSRRSFFGPSPPQKAGGHRPPLQGDSNEVERANILAPGFRVTATGGTHPSP